MKNRVRNTLGYTGIVTLSQYIGSKKVKVAQIHNTGASPLFDFLTDCLLGDFAMARAIRPNKIMILQRDMSKAETDNTAYSRSPGGGDFFHILTRPEKRAANVVRYSFMIPRDILDSINDFEKLYIGLYADGASLDEPENYAAICKLGLSKNTIASASLVVDWELAFSNNTTNSN